MAIAVCSFEVRPQQVGGTDQSKARSSEGRTEPCFLPPLQSSNSAAQPGGLLLSVLSMCSCLGESFSVSTALGVSVH
jgi:hypothetical protein